MVLKSCLGTIIFLLMISAADARVRPFTRDCPAGASENFRDVVEFLDVHMSAVRTIYEADNNYHPRRGANRRVERRLGRDRKLGRLWFACANDSAPLCDGSSGRHAFGAASNKIRICYKKVSDAAAATPDRGFCRLTELVAHEFGHAVGIKKDRVGNHSDNQNDRVYRWGWAWGDYCRSGGFNRDLR
ncbi:MAG: hypothetical protein HKN14_15970 [Marinicaulis sp.]|nr:hypothetical protein [Marinicaulis sp.]NNL87586.1 hypothetical protein [Marinicaulis sp.]